MSKVKYKNYGFLITSLDFHNKWGVQATRAKEVNISLSLLAFFKVFYKMELWFILQTSPRASERFEYGILDVRVFIGHSCT